MKAGSEYRHGAGGGVSGARTLDQVVAGLENRIEELISRQRTIRMLVLGGSVLLLGLMGLFGLSLYSTLQRRLNMNQLQNAFMDKIDEVLPPLSQKFMDSAIKAGPAYGELAMKSLEKIRPQLETMLVDETSNFSQRLQTNLLRKTEMGLTRVTDRVSADLKNQLPNLTEQKLDAIEKVLRDSLLVEGGGVAEQLESKVGKERERVEKLFEKLPIAEVAKQPEEKLQRQFIHHVLMMIDNVVASEPKDAE